ncbi:MAG: AmmeMemoRadiSam system protein A [Desulfurococcales archaeon]|nr:AmmeMemoRadiSam system protein A [Desulfurococcales archaeon]
MVGSGRLRISFEKPIEPWELGDQEGEVLVRLARKSIESVVLRGKEPIGGVRAPSSLYRPGAAFVTIEKLRGSQRTLRGCIGFFKAVRPLVQVVKESAIEAALRDPRFPPLAEDELESIVVEVSVLSSPVELPSRPDRRIEELKIGRDGLIVSRPPYIGLLLPQVAIEHGWDPVIFLTEACIKAGLSPTCWTEKTTRIYRFTASVWMEEAPRGPIKRKMAAEKG